MIEVSADQSVLIYRTIDVPISLVSMYLGKFNQAERLYLGLWLLQF